MAKNNRKKIFIQLKESFADFKKNEAELAKAELLPMAKNAAYGGASMGIAGLLLTQALWLIILALALAFTLLFVSLTTLSALSCFLLGTLCAAVLLLIIAVILLIIGKRLFATIGLPTQTIAEAKETLQAIKLALKNDNDTTKKADSTPVTQLSD